MFWVLPPIAAWLSASAECRQPVQRPDGSCRVYSSQTRTGPVRPVSSRLGTVKFERESSRAAEILRASSLRCAPRARFICICCPFQATVLIVFLLSPCVSAGNWQQPAGAPPWPHLQQKYKHTRINRRRSIESWTCDDSTAVLLPASPSAVAT